MSAVPQLRPTRVRRRRRHGGALLAALAYGVAAFALYQLVAPSFDRDGDRAAAPERAVAAAPPAQAELSGVGPREELALRAVAARVQQSVYTVRGQGASSGSAFTGWVYQGKVSLVLTARSAVAGASGKVRLTHGRRSLRARVVRSDPTTGLAVLRVNTALDRPLWQRADDRAPLRDGAPVLAVPAGKSGNFGQGRLAMGARGFSLPAVGDGHYLGAPVLDDDGQLAGIVVGLSSSGSRVVSLADACGRVRACD